MTALVSNSGDPRSPSIEPAKSSGDGVIEYMQSFLPAGETIRFQERGVALSDSYALLNFKLYPLRDIHGSNLREESRDRSVILTIVVLGSMLGGLLSFVSMYTGIAILVVSAVLALALRLSVPSTHVLRIITAEGERDALLARDRKYLLRVFEELNIALSRAHS